MDRIENFEVNSPRWLSLEDFEGEVWKDVPGYEGIYRASSFGRIKSLGWETNYKNKKGVAFKRYFHSHILKAHVCDGYLYVNFKKTPKYIHRIVAIAFLPNPLNKKEIDHIDTNRSNNNIANLRWATRSENMLNILTNAKEKIAQSIPIVALDYFGNYVCEFVSIWEATKQLHTGDSTIYDCITYKRTTKTVKGLQFIRKAEYDKDKDYCLLLKKCKNSKHIVASLCMVVVINELNEIVDVYPNVNNASKSTNYSYQVISKRCRKQLSIDGEKWFYFKNLPLEKKDEALSLFLKKYNKKAG